MIEGEQDATHESVARGPVISDFIWQSLDDYYCDRQSLRVRANRFLKRHRAFADPNPPHCDEITGLLLSSRTITLDPSGRFIIRESIDSETIVTRP